MSLHEMERAIDVTRDDLNRTLNALQAKLSPRRRLNAAWGATRAGGEGAVRSGVAWAVANPLLVLALGAAVVSAVWYRARDRRRS